MHLNNKFFCHHNIIEKSHSKLSRNESVCKCKEGWCLGLGQEGGCLCEGVRNCLKYLKMGWNGLGQGCLKKGAGTPLRTMSLDKTCRGFCFKKI